jgi:hypothetical protein
MSHCLFAWSRLYVFLALRRIALHHANGHFPLFLCAGEELSDQTVLPLDAETVSFLQSQ